MKRKSGKHPRDERGVQSDWLYAFKLLFTELRGRLGGLFGLALLVVVFSSILAALSPVLLKLIVDALTDPAASTGVYLSVGALVLVYAGSHWLGRALGELRSLIVGRADQRLHRRLSSRLFKHVMSLPLRFHLNRKAGALSQTLANGLNGYRLVVQHLVLTVLPVILELLTMSAVLLVLGQPVFLGIILTTLICYAVVFALGAVLVTRPSREISTAHIDATALMTDSIVNYETIKSFCAESHAHERMDSAFARTESHWKKFFSSKAINGVLVGTVFAASLGLSVFVAVREVQQGRMGLGDFVLVNAYMLQIFRPMEMLGFAFRDVAQGVAFIEKMVELFKQEPESSAYSDDESIPQGPGDLVFDHVCFSYDKQNPVLRGVSFRIPAGKTAALVGASGSGKSSLIRLLVRFWEPESGRILLDGSPISEMAVGSLREAIAIVPQDTVLFNDTIGYNISIAHPDSSKEDIQAAAKLAQIHDFIAARPEGYEAVVGERGLKLSGGEKQRIAIARAALKKPKVFVFDEATSSLDSKTEQRILQNIESVSRGTTTLIVAHRLSTIVGADEILVLDKGKIVERGTHEDLLYLGGVYHEMWKVQQHAQEDEKSPKSGNGLPPRRSGSPAL